MKISKTSKDLLEFLFLTGVDALANSANTHAFFRSYGGWENHSSYLRQMRRIREQGLLNWDEKSPPGTWVPLLTEQGSSQLSERIDPRPKWEAAWDGQWRSITFDLPYHEQTERKRLNRWLTQQRFGHLQGSLWFSPLPYENWAEDIGKLNIDPSSVIFMEGRPLGSLDDATIVSKCWSFSKLAEKHTEYLKFIDEAPDSDLEALPDWVRQETNLWRECIELDPLLPKELHPPNYKGTLCWEKRLQAYAQWSNLLTPR